MRNQLLLASGFVLLIALGMALLGMRKKYTKRKPLLGGSVLALAIAIGLGSIPAYTLLFGEDPKEEHSNTGLLRTQDTGKEETFDMTLPDGQQGNVRIDPDTGTPAWLSGDFKPPGGTTAEEKTMSYFDANKEIYHMKSPASELKISREEMDQSGMSHLHMNQIHKGVPVFGSELAVHISKEGNIRTINGHFGEQDDISVEPSVTPDQAIAAAKKDIDSQDSDSTGDPVLFIYNSPKVKTTLVWRCVIATEEPLQMLIYFIDAQNMDVVAKYNSLETAHVETLSAENKEIKFKDINTNFVGKTMIDTLVGPLTSDDPTSQKTHDNVNKTQLYFKQTHSRDSYDNKGIKIQSIVHFGKEYCNAFWNGKYLVFGDGSSSCAKVPFGLSLDVVAHEFTHAVNSETANLIYQDQSGALSESFSDVFGVMVDREDWLIGEDIALNSEMRNLEDPTSHGQPAHMDDYKEPWLLPCNDISNDHCFVHTNSGIPNKAAFNAAVRLGGKEKVEKIWYRSLSLYLTPTSQFRDLRDACIQSARDLYGEDKSVEKAIDQAFSDVGIYGDGNVQEASARVVIEHTNREDLYVMVGVGDPESPTWSTMIPITQGGTPEGFSMSIDISEASRHLPASEKEPWFLRVEDKNSSNAGSIKEFKLIDRDGNVAEASDLPIEIRDNQASISFIPSREQTPKPQGGQSDTTLVVDISGSMSSNMGSITKLDAAKNASKSVLSMIKNESTAQRNSHQVALASFSDTGTIDHFLAADFAGAESAINGLQVAGGTNVGDGLLQGLRSLSSSTSDRERIIVLLSDGQSNSGMSTEQILSGPVATARNRGIKIFTIGFGQPGDLDEEFLKQIASQTGGEYFYANEAFKLDNVYIALRHKSGGQQIAALAGRATGPTQEVGDFNVDVSNGELHGTVNWEDNRSKLMFKDPDGRIVDSEYPGAVLFDDSKPAYVIVKNPLPGNWTAIVDPEGGGESTYDVVVSAQEGTRELSDYPRALLAAALASVLLSLGSFAVLRRPIRI